MTEVLSQAWVAAVAEASADRSGVGTAGVVAITIGKTRQAVLHIEDGRVQAPGEGVEAGVTIPLTARQLEAIVAGTESLAQSFMRGDVKPVGATGPLLAAIELFEDVSFRQRLAELA